MKRKSRKINAFFSPKKESKQGFSGNLILGQLQFTLCFVILASKFTQVSFGKEIYTLLLQHDIVTIPGLGAFVSAYHPAEINDETNEMQPPSKSISFNEQLRNNDGLLVGHIAEKLRISHLSALTRVEKERDEMLFNLDKGDEVIIEGVGSLSYDDDGVIVFKASVQENMLIDSFGLESMSIIEPEPIVNQPGEQEQDTKAVTPEPELPHKPLKDEAPTTNKQETGKNPLKNSGEPQEEKEKKKSWLFLLIIIPLIAVSIFIFMKGFNDGKKSNESLKEVHNAEKLPVEQEIVAIDTIVNDSLAASMPDTITISDTTKAISEPAEVVPQQQDSIRYYLVGGSFSVKENADNYLLELQKKGYNAFHVGKKGRFFIVAIDSSKTFSEAEIAKEEYLLNNPESEVWVYRK